jgi:hypothetical protein
MAQSQAHSCELCAALFPSRNQLFRHLRDAHTEGVTQRGTEGVTQRGTEEEGEEEEGPRKQKQKVSRGSGSGSGGVSERGSEGVSEGVSGSARPGRVARRRNKEERLRLRSQQCGPRLHSLTAFARRAPGLTLQDAQEVTDQLGFAPTNLIEVSE